jgi:hypothetical protein
VGAGAALDLLGRDPLEPVSVPRWKTGLLVAGFLAALAIRLALLLSFHGNYDTQSYDLVTEIAQKGGDLYAEPHRYNYSPLWSRVLMGVAFASDLTGVKRTTLVGLLLLAGDAATAALVFLLVHRRRGRAAAGLAALTFFANPVSILVSSAHLQFDGLAILFLVAAVALSEKGRDLGAAASLTLSVLLKHVTGVHPLLFRRRPGWRGVLPVVAPYIVFLASFAPYAASWRQIRDWVVLYHGLTFTYGTEVLLLVPGVPEWLPMALFAAAVLVALVWLQKVELAQASLLLYLVILIFAPGFGRQYCVWPIALGAVSAGLGFALYSVVAGAFLLSENFHPTSFGWALPGWYGPWWAAVVWFLWEWRRRGLNSRGEMRAQERQRTRHT